MYSMSGTHLETHFRLITEHINNCVIANYEALSNFAMQNFQLEIDIRYIVV